MIKKIILTKKLKTVFFLLFCHLFIFSVQVLKILHNLLEINFVNEYIYTANCMLNVFFFLKIIAYVCCTHAFNMD